MKNKQIVRGAIKTYANEVAKTLQTVNYILENVSEFKKYSTLLENKADVTLFKELFGFGSKKGPVSGLASDELALARNLATKVSNAQKEVGKLSRATMEDPEKLGFALSQMLDLLADVQTEWDFATKVAKEKSGAEQEELMKELMPVAKAKQALFGVVAFKLSEIRKEAQSALQRLIKLAPKEASNYLDKAMSGASADYTPSVPMRSALDRITGGGLSDTGGKGLAPRGAVRGLEEDGVPMAMAEEDDTSDKEMSEEDALMEAIMDGVEEDVRWNEAEHEVKK